MDTGPLPPDPLHWPPRLRRLLTMMATCMKALAWSFLICFGVMYLARIFVAVFTCPWLGRCTRRRCEIHIAILIAQREAPECREFERMIRLDTPKREFHQLAICKCGRLGFRRQTLRTFWAMLMVEIIHPHLWSSTRGHVLLCVWGCRENVFCLWVWQTKEVTSCF